MEGSTIDWPDHLASVVFTKGCNWDCEYCHNSSLNTAEDMNMSVVFSILEENKDITKRVIISGGEPTIHGDRLVSFVKALHSRGFKIGLNTNGSKPSVIHQLLPMLDFISMDIKTTQTGYCKYIFKHLAIGKQGEELIKIRKSISTIIKSGIDYEFRTTLYPKYISIDDIKEISVYLAEKGATKYVIQQYEKVEGLDVSPIRIDVIRNNIPSITRSDLEIHTRGIPVY